MIKLTTHAIQPPSIMVFVANWPVPGTEDLEAKGKTTYKRLPGKNCVSILIFLLRLLVTYHSILK